MEYLEKEINEWELIVLNILNALDCMYSDSFSKYIQELMSDLIKVLINEVYIIIDDDRYFEDFKLLMRVYLDKLSLFLYEVNMELKINKKYTENIYFVLNKEDNWKKNH